MGQPQETEQSTGAGPKHKGDAMNQREYKILALTIIFSMMALIVIVQAGTNIIDKYYNPRPEPKVEVVTPTPAINVPTPSKGYFVECMHDDMALVQHHDSIYVYTCERGKWKLKTEPTFKFKDEPNDKDNRNLELPESPKHNT